MRMNYKIIKLGELIEFAHEDSILFINTSSSVGKVILRLLWNVKSAFFSKGDCKVIWDASE